MDDAGMNAGDIGAVIDLGSNSARLLIARALGPFGFEVIDEERFDARLGEGQADGLLSAPALQRGLDAMRTMAAIAATYRPAAITVVGTEALRNATNANMLLAAVAAETGLDVTVLSAPEEAAASFLGVINSTTLSDGEVLDLGGGSIEVMSVRNRALVAAQSAPLGAIYARERYLTSDPPTSRQVHALRKAVRQQLDGLDPAPSLVGTGGAIRNLARIVRQTRHYPLRRIHGMVLRHAEVHRLARQLSRIPEDQRRKVPGIGARAATIHAAAIVVDEVMHIAVADDLVVAGQGLREGLLWRHLRAAAPVLPDVRSASAQALASANGVDFAAARPVYATALRLFDTIADLAGLTAADRDLLQTSAQLSQIGTHIDYYDRERHAEYMVLSGDLHGFTHREVVLLAAIIRWSESGTVSLGLYRDLLTPGDAEHAAMLACVLGVAQAVHRRTPSAVVQLDVQVKRRVLRLTIHARDAALPELAALARQQARFSAAFHLDLQARAVKA
jgi:exopolyphosphatase/guanosine-5'-triphosphate,3'-diphosphate pyrophosphatase